MAENGEDLVAQYDLLPKLLPFMDRHLAFPLINNLPSSDEVAQLKYELLKNANMVDYVAELYKEINNTDSIPAELQKKREDVLKQREQYQQETSKLTGLLEDQEVVSNLRSDKVANLNFLKDTHGVKIEMVNALYEFGQLQFSCGDYGGAADLLYQFRVLVRVCYFSPSLMLT
jgi:translation initiation factor 3 subunit E